MAKIISDLEFHGFIFSHFKHLGAERQRRDVTSGDDWQRIFDLNLNLEKFNQYIKTKSNETFQEEINRALMKFLLNLPSKQLCKLFKNCGKGRFLIVFFRPVLSFSKDAF